MKPCPFCGGVAAFLIDNRGTKYGPLTVVISVYCTECGVRTLPLDATDPRDPVIRAKAQEFWDCRVCEKCVADERKRQLQWEAEREAPIG